MDDTDKLYLTVQEYIENRGGKVLVIGGVQIVQYPSNAKHKYSIAIKFLGRKPSLIKEEE